MREGVLDVDGAAVADVLVADTYASRLRGMLARRPLPEAMILRPSRSVHGVGMLAALDVAMLDGDDVVRSVAVLRPFGLRSSDARTRSVLEAPRGSFARWGLTVGSAVRVRPAAG